MSIRLTRSRDHRIIGGICGGLGDYFRIDPIIFRFTFIALLLAGGSSIVIYLILWLVVPKEPKAVSMNHAAGSPQGYDSSQPGGTVGEADKSVNLVMGLLLIAVGVFMLLHNLVPYFRLEKLWPAILVILGLGLLFQKGRKSDNNTQI
jgi:phage shock protein C